MSNKEKTPKKRIIVKKSKIIDGLIQTVETQNEKIEKLEKRTKLKKKKPETYLSVHPANFLQTMTDDDE